MSPNIDNENRAATQGRPYRKLTANEYIAGNYGGTVGAALCGRPDRAYEHNDMVNEGKHE